MSNLSNMFNQLNNEKLSKRITGTWDVDRATMVIVDGKIRTFEQLYDDKRFPVVFESVSKSTATGYKVVLEVPAATMEAGMYNPNSDLRSLCNTISYDKVMIPYHYHRVSMFHPVVLPHGVLSSIAELEEALQGMTFSDALYELVNSVRRYDALRIKIDGEEQSFRTKETLNLTKLLHDELYHRKNRHLLGSIVENFLDDTTFCLDADATAELHATSVVAKKLYIKINKSGHYYRHGGRYYTSITRLISEEYPEWKQVSDSSSSETLLLRYRGNTLDVIYETQTKQWIGDVPSDTPLWKVRNRIEEDLNFEEEE